MRLLLVLLLALASVAACGEHDVDIRGTWRLLYLTDGEVRIENPAPSGPLFTPGNPFDLTGPETSLDSNVADLMTIVDHVALRRTPWGDHLVFSKGSSIRLEFERVPPQRGPRPVLGYRGVL